MRPNAASRREFLAVSGAAVAAGLFSARVLGAPGAGEKLNMGIIGVGGRGGANLAGVAGEAIYALCDVDSGALGQASRKHPKAKTFTDWRKLLEDDQIDAVVISTADHHHALAALAAMRAGKHVYCEKPLAHTVHEARLMQQEALARKGKIATQMGTQIHAEPNYRRVVELIQGGAIGPVSEAHVWCDRGIKPVGAAVLAAERIPAGFDWDSWLGPAPLRPYNPGYWDGGNLNWNRRWEFGNGVLGDMGSHLIDLPFWALELHQPTSIASEGPDPDPIACPPWQVVTWEHPARTGNPNCQVPTKVVWYHGQEGMQRRAAVLQPMVGDDTKINEWPIGVAFVGTKGVLVADYKRLLLCPVAKFVGFQAPAQSIQPSIGHYLEWIQAAKTGGESLCHFGYSGALIEHNLLGNVAHRLGSKLVWDAAKFAVGNVPAAAAMLTKDYRAGWSV